MSRSVYSRLALFKPHWSETLVRAAIFPLVLCSTSAWAEAPDALNKQTKFVTRGEYADGVFAVASDGTGIPSHLVAADNALTIGGSTKVNGPVGAFALRHVSSTGINTMKLEAHHNVTTIDASMQASGIRGVFLNKVKEANVFSNTTVMNGGVITSQRKATEENLDLFSSHGVMVKEVERAILHDNSFDMNGGVLEDGSLYGVKIDGAKTAELHNNTINMRGGALDGSVFATGAWNVSDAVTATDNTFFMTDGQFTGSEAKGGIFGFTSWKKPETNVATKTIAATHNRARIYGGSFPKGINNLVGAWLRVSDTAEAHDNGVYLKQNVNINKVVAGALVHKENDLMTAGTAVNLTNNWVVLDGNPTFTQGSYLLGAGIDNNGRFDESLTMLNGQYKPEFDLFSGNYLLIKGKNVKASKVGNFEYYGFELSDFKTDEDVALQADEIYLENPNRQGQQAKLDNLYTRGEIFLHKGLRWVLIRADKIYGAFEGFPGEGESYFSGISTKATAQIIQSERQLNGKTVYEVAYTIVSDPQVTPYAKVFSQASLASLSMVNQASDLVSIEGKKAALMAAEAPNKAFVMVSGSHGRYLTGSHVDSNSMHMMAGLAHAWPLNAGKLSVAGFVEAGRGRYDTHLTVDNVDERGDGKTHYEGAGFLAGLERTNGWYAEASVRVGRVHNQYSYRSKALSFMPASAFDFSLPYVGAHVGVGRKWQLSNQLQFDTYAQYLYARQGSQNTVTDGAKDVLKFDAVSSHRVRLGARLDWLPSTTFHPYVGAAFEHEFSAKAGVSTFGLPIDAAKMKGSSGMLEAGLRMLPSASSGKGWALDANVRGYVGKRKEVSAHINVGYAF